MSIQEVFQLIAEGELSFNGKDQFVLAYRLLFGPMTAELKEKESFLRDQARKNQSNYTDRLAFFKDYVKGMLICQDWKVPNTIDDQVMNTTK